MQRVAIIDTSLMCCWLKVPGCETAGSAPDLWDYNRTKQLLDQLIADSYKLVFPFTTLVETGNHIARAASNRFEKAQEFMQVLRQASTGEAPWTSFADQFETIRETDLEVIAAAWPVAAARGLSLGDHLITAVADYYSLAGFEVKILSSDNLLRQYVPKKPTKEPRRRG